MTLKRMIKETFKEEFRSEKMKENILLKAESNQKKRVKNVLKVSIPLCTLLVLFFIGFSFSHFSKISDKIYINNLKYRNDISRLNTDIEEKMNLEEGPIFQVFEKRSLPSDFEKEMHKRVITKKQGEKDIVKYVSTFYGKKDRYIEISLSKDKIKFPFEEEIKKSKINGIELIIYQYDASYVSNFFYQGYYFNIQSYDIREEEFITLLKSILKESDEFKK